MQDLFHIDCKLAEGIQTTTTYQWNRIKYGAGGRQANVQCGVVALDLYNIILMVCKVYMTK